MDRGNRSSQFGWGAVSDKKDEKLAYIHPLADVVMWLGPLPS
jgi:hypothetical protein